VVREARGSEETSDAIASVILEVERERLSRANVRRQAGDRRVPEANFPATRRGRKFAPQAPSLSRLTRPPKQLDRCYIRTNLLAFVFSEAL
jgi:hypothetical protein